MSSKRGDPEGAGPSWSDPRPERSEASLSAQLVPACEGSNGARAWAGPSLTDCGSDAAPQLRYPHSLCSSCSQISSRPHVILFLHAVIIH